jgi:hypothetical protein
VWQSLRGTQDPTHLLATSTPTATPMATATSRSPILAPAGAPAALAFPSAFPSTRAASDVASVASVTDESPTPQAAPPVLLTTTHASAHAPAPAPAPALAPAPAQVPSSAAALFDLANTARRAGDTGAALARYDALEQQFPGTPEARVAKATTGKLLLDGGDAAGALARFDAYIASGSTELREEAMAGRATALERLGREDEEARGWAALLASYPGTPYSAHAKSRVGRSLPR